MPAGGHAADPLIAELIGLFERGQTRLEGIVHDGLSRGLNAQRINGPDQIAGDATHAYRVRQHQQAGAIIAGLKADVGRHGPLIAGRAYRAGAIAVDRSLPASNVLGGAFGGVHVRAAEAIAQNMTGAMTDALDRVNTNIGLVFERADALEAGLPISGVRGFPFVGRRLDDPYRSAALETVGQGFVAQDTRRQVTAQLARRLVNEGTTDALAGFVDRSGRRWSLEAYTSMVARTTTREAVSRGTVNRLAEAGQDLVEISSHPHTADECTAYDGRTFSLEGKTPGYDQLDQLPPFHPNCLHVVTPAAADLAAWEAEVGNAIAETEPPRAPARKTAARKPRAPRKSALEKRLAAGLPKEDPRLRDEIIRQAYRVTTSPTQGSRIEAALNGGRGAALTADDEALIAEIKKLVRYKEVEREVAAQAAQRDPAALARALKRHPDLADDVIDGHLVIEAPDAAITQRHLDEYAQIPANVRKALQNAGTKVHIGDKPVPELDDLGHLRRVQPRGYGPDQTWMDAAGAYSPGHNVAVAGDTANGHGSASLVGHEVGHALDRAIAPGPAAQASDLSPEFDAHHRRLYPRLQTYYAQGGPGGQAGKSELFAEAFGQILADEARARRRWDDPFVDYMLRLIAHAGQE